MTDVIFPDSLWAATALPRTPAPPLDADTDADTVVIGGGFTGLSAALELARSGQRVVLLEAEAVGWGASGRNNGQVIPTMTAAEPDALAARYNAAGERFARLVGNSASVLFDIVRREGIEAEAEAEQAGWFQPAHSPGRVALSRARVEAWQRFGFPARLLDRAEATALLGSDFWYGGMLNPTGGHINPLGLARGMARAAEAHGATLHETTPVTGWQRDGDRWTVTTQGGRKVRARHMILATSTYTGELVPGLASRLARTVVPVLSWQMATAPISDNVRRTILPGRQAVSDTRGDLRFFRYDARNRLITGGVVIGEHDVRRRVAAKAARNLADAFPALGEQSMTHVWSGYVGMTWDRFPRVHSLGPDAWTWIGCNGRGVALGVSLGREMARAVSGAALDTLALPVVPIPAPLPFHSIARRVAPSYLAWLRRKDLQEMK
ncbi:glycine/D-amino acid oxidase-like deaminating enzyme [Amaricoccus macauensis]|uniref:Glycine/D-amino acid oxidase-like deaminating enzyme n=1 Tax=Amaricoccus macauensis TaxID=57001 RepID=A0A840SUT5_9RHOB|nr:FAD-binding oxidoreductase [Amaricoccus macauensis]MBB5222902.1 glycine/D-amino acid oxidase-like deaminating enzyme [Amaricoccus macauensis]